MVNRVNRKRNIGMTSLLIVAILVLMSGSVFAQVAVTGTADALIVTAITVAATTALDFGSVYPGVPKIQDQTSATLSGVFTITGLGDAGITSQFMLPEYVALASGADRMTISFSASDASIDSSAAGTPAAFGSDGAYQDQDPRGLPVHVLGNGGETRIYLGGKVIPSPYQSAGSYSGDIILTVFYNGS